MSWSADETDDFPDDTGIVREIISRGICNTIHFFSELPGEEHELAKEATGIANHQGGVILLGVKKSGEIVGLTSPEETRYSASETLEEYIEPKLQYNLRVKEVEEGSIIIIKIERYTETPYDTIHAMNKKFYMRSFNSSKPISPVEVANIIRNID